MITIQIVDKDLKQQLTFNYNFKTYNYSDILFVLRNFISTNDNIYTINVNDYSSIIVKNNIDVIIEELEGVLHFD